MKRIQFYAAMLVLAFTTTALSDEVIKGEAGKTVELAYKKTADKTLNVFTHFPDDWKPSDKRPAIIFFFGGGWTKGLPKQFENQATYLAKRGMVCFRADYTLGKGPDVCVEDARDAIRWMRAYSEKLGIDADKIVASGGSAGGHLAACLGCCHISEPKASSSVQAMILFNPALDMIAIAGDGKRGIDEKKAKMIDPLSNYARGAPPTIMFFGTADRLMEPAKTFVAKGIKLGNRVEMYTADNQPHGFFNKSPWQERTLLEAEKFLVSLGYLKGESTLKVPASDLPEVKKYAEK